ncbi:hypothetical protein L1O03_01340 [Corynebacterium uropygiale]|uniref:Uncharacterized protein n=1 Tax=Corynebacterium uropygiale TaxID=1775911 RepID=A0A9X1QP34_9CORY|nr:hypothetical protein [Corynebacterium uropygiale]MCF4005822.1 hypothetical protein [Corynebacterium uropygiale]
MTIKEQRSEPRVRPDAVKVFCQLWIAGIILELVHQVLSIIMSAVDPSQLREQVVEQAKQQNMPLPEDMLSMITVLAFVFMGVIALIVALVLAFATQRVHRGTKRSGVARSLLTFFSIYFVLRLVLVMLSSPQGTAVPLALFAVDGSVQIIVGVIGALAMYCGRREETLRWTGEWQMIENLRRGGK